MSSFLGDTEETTNHTLTLIYNSQQRTVTEMEFPFSLILWDRCYSRAGSPNSRQLVWKVRSPVPSVQCSLHGKEAKEPTDIASSCLLF